MKVRNDYVTNSSSSSFVISKNKTDAKYIRYIEDNFTPISEEDLDYLCDVGAVDDIYYLVDYEPEDEYMHIWVRRDELMNDDFIDDILFMESVGDSEIWDEKQEKWVTNEDFMPPKFDRHY